MNFKRLYIIVVLCVTALFAVFTLMHSFDWLIPPSPVNSVSNTQAVPFPDTVEEHGEDDLTHSMSESNDIPNSLESKKICMIFEDLFIPQVSTPPPDYII